MHDIHINWDLTYACQLRCVHCYSQAGRRPSRAVEQAQQQAIAARLVDAGVTSVAFAGGEPLLEPGLWALAEQLRQGGVATSLYTNGLKLDSEHAARAAQCFSRVHVSVDSPDAVVHDLVRGRPGAFVGALAAVQRLVQAGACVGLDATLLRSTFDQAPRFAVELLPRLAGVAFLNVGAVVPAGLASRPAFGTELLTDAQLQALDDGTLQQTLAALAPPGVAVHCHSNRDLSLAPHWPAARGAPMVVQVEPDGAVRAMPLYEGTVGSLLHEPLDLLLERARAMRDEPQVRQLLAGMVNATSWAAATRRLDWANASAPVRQLIERRNNRIWMTMTHQH
jgi:organic radical activating enzyme